VWLLGYEGPAHIYIYIYIYIYINSGYTFITAIYIYIHIYIYIYIYQYPSFKVDHRAAWDLRRRTEIIPVKDSHTPHQNKTVGFGQRPRPLHIITVTPERALVFVGEWPLHMAVINF
jgi:hypothetical protein